MNSIQAVTPISVFGPISKYALIKQYNCRIELHENYQKRSMRNRIEILNSNGRFRLSVPLIKGKTKTAIRDVKIAYSENWIKDHLQGIKSAYANAAYFDFYFDKIEKIYKSEPKYLIDFFDKSYSFLKSIAHFSDYTTTDRFIKDYAHCFDYRSTNKNFTIEYPFYNQVFEEKFGYEKNLSILDLIMNQGPNTSAILNNCKITFTNSIV